MSLRSPWIFIPLLMIFISGCFSLNQPAVTLQYYTLDYEAPKLDATPLKATMALGRFRAVPPFTGTRIIYQDASYKINHYAYHRWQAPPADMVAGLFRRDLQTCGLFGAVTREDSAMKSTYLLEVEIEEFLEKDGELWQASLRLTTTLLRQDDQNVVPILQKTYSAVEPCTRKNPRALAQAMSLALARISTEMIQDTHQAISKDSTK